MSFHTEMPVVPVDSCLLSIVQTKKLKNRVTGNWRITFRFENGDVFDVDLEDYHG